MLFSLLRAVAASDSVNRQERTSADNLAIKIAAGTLLPATSPSATARRWPGRLMKSK